MTALLITAGYLLVTVATGKWVYSALYANSTEYEQHDPESRTMDAFVSLVAGLLWPLSIPFMLLMRIIIGPNTNKRTQNERNGHDEQR